MQIQGKYRCINCFKELNDEDEICSCRYSLSDYKLLSHWLVPGTILDNRYCVGRVIGEGGFGITYVGYDINLDIKIAIKEFYLSGINSRNSTVSDNIETGIKDRETMFENYRDKFINEAKILARFNGEEGVVSVYNFFKSNNTAYIIMEYLEGETLKEYLKARQTISVEETLAIFLPVMEALDKVHATNLIHRDISPDNIMFGKNGKIKLLDFGAAREVADGNKSLSVVLKHGYAPPEQYKTHGKQGPWTDVYAMSATIYKCLTGKTPIEAIERLTGESLEPVFAITSNCSEKISNIVMKGLEISIENRYQTMGEMVNELKSACESMKCVQKETVENTAINLTSQIVNPYIAEVHNNTEFVSYDNQQPQAEYRYSNQHLSGQSPLQDEHRSYNKKRLKVPFIILLSFIIMAMFGGFIYSKYIASDTTADYVVEKEKQNETESNTAEEYKPKESEIISDISDNQENNSDDKELAETETNSNVVIDLEYTYLYDANVGDIVKFGDYKGHTAWRVLKKENNILMLITEDIPECMAFNDENEECDWSSCTLRDWLNNEYYNLTFSDEEKSLIINSDIDGEKDKVFILSQKEVEKLFKYESDRIAHNSDKETEYKADENYGWIWWLRSPTGFDNEGYYYYASNVFEDGIIRSYCVIGDRTGVRPVINVDLSNNGNISESKDDPVEKEVDISEPEEIEPVSNSNTAINSEYAYLANVECGDIVDFGNYNGYSSWRVLKKENNKILLITEEIIAKKPYNSKYEKCDWNTCSLRAWLNNDYYEEAFSEEEKALIIESDVDGVSDKVYLLSKDEAENLFTSKRDRVTKYNRDNWYWWLRSPVSNSDNGHSASFVDYDGSLDHKFSLTYEIVGVRPIINVDLSNF